MIIWDGDQELQITFFFTAKGITVAASRRVDKDEWIIIESVIHEMGCPDCLRGDWGEH